jgi:hypothetical protein
MVEPLDDKVALDGDGAEIAAPSATVTTAAHQQVMGSGRIRCQSVAD